jgi:uncharacterized repeat protein (TIGR01451 family)
VIVNSTNSVNAPSPQVVGGVSYAFQSWSDGQAQSHNIVAGTTNATYTATYASASADLQIVKTGTLSADKTSITYALRVTNLGPGSALNVRVTDTLSNKLQWVSASSTQGSCSGTSTVTCAIGNMSNGQVTTITIVVRITKQSGFITNSASVSGDSTDPNSANNTSTIQTKAR